MVVVVCGGVWWQAAVVCGGSEPFLLCSRQQPREKRAERACVEFDLCCWCGVCWSAQRWRSTKALAAAKGGGEAAEDAAEDFKGKAAVGLEPVVLYCWARARGGGGGGRVGSWDGSDCEQQQASVMEMAKLGGRLWRCRGAQFAILNRQLSALISHARE